MNSSAGKIPDKPRFNSSEKELSGLGKSLYAGNIIKNPLDFCCGKVSVNDEAGVSGDVIAQFLVLFNFFAHIGGSSALPNNGVVNGLARCSVPKNGCFALIGDADTGDILSVNLTRIED